MGVISFIRSLFRRKDSETQENAQEELVRRSFQARCSHFKALLAANKRALEAMASLEEALQGERFFAMSFVRASCTTILANVFNMVRHLNALTQLPEHALLFDRLKQIQQKITVLLEPKFSTAYGEFVLPLKSIDLSHISEVGGKMASLGEAANKLDISVPQGFAITASAYRMFLESTGLQEEIFRRMQLADLSRLDEVFALSESIQKLIMEAEVPETIVKAIHSACKQLAEEAGNIRLAVRSSALGEDSAGASHAGQYHSALNVPMDALLENYKKVIASKYSPRAMSYRFSRGIPDREVVMCVGCLAMIPAIAGGVLYSTDPLYEKNAVFVYAVPGLPKSVVDGTTVADIFQVSRDDPHTIESRVIAKKQTQVVCSAEKGLVTEPVPSELESLPCVTDHDVMLLARLAMRLELFYGLPQDVEWAKISSGQIIVLQTRPLPGSKPVITAAPPIEGARVLMEGGITASSGIGAGTVFRVLTEEQMLQFPRGAVLVVENSHSRWAPLLSQAAAVVAERGGAAGHLASVAREYGVPAIFGLAGAMSQLEEHEEITVDAYACRIYAGLVSELFDQINIPKKIFAGSPVHATLAKCAHYIVPLNLLYPDAATFSPEFCETLHDITRYCHEKAVEAMFTVDESLFSERCGKQLRYKGGKLQYYVINLGQGFASEPTSKFIDFEQISSLPMRALWEGMLAIEWYGPPTSSTRSLLSVIAESAANPELEVSLASPRLLRNYFLIDRDYCNLQASFGYHFCTVEAQLGDVVQENFVSFHFKGGAANLAKRQLRVNVLAEVLSEHGFIVDCKEDVLSARAEEVPVEQGIRLLFILGYLLVHTRQVDAIMQSEASKGHFRNVLKEGIAKVLRLCEERFDWP